MRLITWNLNARLRQLPEQLAALAARTPDFVALQEVTNGRLDTLRDGLGTLGFAHVLTSFDDAPPWEAVGPRRYGLVIASRGPAALRSSECSAPWPERILSVEVAAPSGSFKLHTTHIPPGSSNGPIKIEMLEAVLKLIAAAAPAPQILCGDFNVPQVETAEGRIVTWGEKISSTGIVKLRRARYGLRGDRWDRAERGAMQGHTDSILIDAYRHLHGYARGDFSWFLKRKALKIGRRFDHAFCSPAVKILRCEYLHDLREQGLSDHSALELDFDI